MSNLGLKEHASKVLKSVNTYNLSEEERKVQYEKIKALRDNKDTGNFQANFNAEDANEPEVIETIRIHEAWLQLGEELMKWGDF